MSLKSVVITGINGVELKNPKVFIGWIVDFISPEYVGDPTKAKFMLEPEAESVVRSLHSRGFSAKVV